MTERFKCPLCKCWFTVDEDYPDTDLCPDCWGPGANRAEEEEVPR